MDNLTHSLVGAILGQAGLKKKTGLGMATLIIAANIPDIDALAVLLGGHQHLAIRRGITHGPIAMLVLPIILTGIMIWFDRWQTRRGKRPENRLPIHKEWLLALAFIGTLSHPAMDWLNSYGVRLLEPFSSRWFYGDSIFIIDIWIWMALIAGVWVSRRREKKAQSNWQRPAILSFVMLVTYIGLNVAISNRANAVVVAAFERSDHPTPTFTVSNPIPLIFWRREMLTYHQDEFGRQYYERTIFHLFRPVNVTSVEPQKVSAAFGSPMLDVVRDKNPDAKAFLFWSRMPTVDFQEIGSEKCGGEGQTLVKISDFRFSDFLSKPRFTVSTKVSNFVYFD